MYKYSLYLLWLPKYFDEYYGSKIENVKNNFLPTLKNFLKDNEYIENYKVKIYDKKMPSDIENEEFVSFYNEKNSIGYWGEIEFSLKNSEKKGQVVFNEFGFYYFEFADTKERDAQSKDEDKKIIESFFSKRYNYPLLTETQEDVLKETFLNDHLDHEEFNRKQLNKKKVKIEDFVREACYVADERDVDIEGKTIQNKILKLQEYQYNVKKDEYYNFETLNSTAKLKPLKDKATSIFSSSKKQYTFDSNTHKKIILDCYEEQAISRFLTTVVSAKYFDRITKSIKEVREGLTGKIIFMTPQDTMAIDSRYQKNIVFQRWSEEKIENYVQLLISKKPLFLKIDNALKSAYYVTIGNLTSLGHINEKEDVSQLLHYHEWNSLLGYFSETTESLSDILKLYHSNRTYLELEEIKHYESNNHDKDDIELLIKSNENKLGSTEDSKNFMLMIAIFATMLMAFPDMVGSVSSFPKNLYNIPPPLWAIIFYITVFSLVSYPFWDEFNKFFKIIGENKREKKRLKKYKYIKSSPDDFDILEHRSNTAIKSYTQNSPHPKKLSIPYQEHISTHRFVRYLEELQLTPCKWSNKSPYRVLPEIVTIEEMVKSDKELYNHIKAHRTTKFSVNRVDKAKIKVTMRYRVNRIKINKFFDYYENIDSYIKFYKNCCKERGAECNVNKCKKIDSKEVIKQLKEDFEGIDAEFSFVAIYSFSLISKTLDYKHKKDFEIYKDSFRVYFHIDKYPENYYTKKFRQKNISTNSEKSCNEIALKPYDAISEMVYLLFLGRLKGFNNNMKQE